MARLTALLLLIAAAAVSAGAVDTMERPKRDDHLPSYSETHGYLSSREEMLATREQRKNQYADRVKEWKDQLDGHNDGRRRLSEGEVYTLERKIRAYETKLDRHLSHDLDNRDVDRLLAREEIRASRNWERRARSRAREL